MRKLVAAASVAVLICGAIVWSGVSTVQAGEPDRFPVMTQAITQLQQIRAGLSTQTGTQALSQLQQVRHAVNTEAGTHYQGHREQALHLMDSAMSQLKQGHSDKAGKAIDKAVAQLQQGVAIAKAEGKK